MKNKIFSFMTVLLVIINGSAFAQDHLRLSSNDLVRRYIKNGVNEIIPNAALALLNEKELEALRMAIYAKHGFIFEDLKDAENDKDLKRIWADYFKGVKWYKPGVFNTTSFQLRFREVEAKLQLSELDKTNFTNINGVYEMAILGLRVNPNLQKKQLVGYWINMFPAPDNCGYLYINDDNTIEINDWPSDTIYRGTYTIEKGYLVVLVASQYSNNRWITYRNKVRLQFPVWDLNKFDYGGYQVRIGYTTWFGGPGE